MKKINILKIISKKRDGFELDKKEIDFFIESVVKNKIKDYQISSMLMAIFINGMNLDETSNLTLSMVNHGKKIDLSQIDGIKIDKHSTGGVSDSTTLIIAPWIASCGLKIFKISGKSLGYTGGTIDKLNSIGINTNFSFEQSIEIVKKSNLAIIEQNQEIAPADKKLYELRDVTSTLESLPLIASSIMSKKIAVDSDAIILDVKFGKGALIKNLDLSIELANTMVSIGKKLNKKIMAIISNMDEPLGSHVGSLLEIQEAIMILKNQTKKNSNKLLEMCYEISANILVLSGLIKDKKTAYEILENKLKNLDAYKKFLDLVKNQSGIFFDYDLIIQRKAKYSLNIYSNTNGFVNFIDASMISQAAFEIGSGRINKEDKIDYEAGIIIKTKINDWVNVNDILFEIFYNDDKKINFALDILEKSIVFGDKKIDIKKNIFKVIY